MNYDIVNKEMERLRKENEALLKRENERLKAENNRLRNNSNNQYKPSYEGPNWYFIVMIIIPLICGLGIMLYVS